MRRGIGFIFALVFLFSLCGCRNNTIENPQSFYYLRKSPSFGTYDSVIAAEVVDGTDFTTISKFLHFYLRGPKDSTLKLPFPPGTYLLDTKLKGDLLTITLSDSFAASTGVSLSLACCALAKTAMDFSGVTTVEIRTASSLLDGEESIKIQRSDLVLYDNCTIPSVNTE